MVLLLLLSSKNRNTPPPRPVIAAFWLWTASAALRFVALIAAALAADGLGLLVLVLFTVLFTAVEIVVGFALRRGSAVARILLVGITVFGLGGFGGSWWWSLPMSLASGAACVLTFVPTARAWFLNTPGV